MELSDFCFFFTICYLYSFRTFSNTYLNQHGRDLSWVAKKENYAETPDITIWISSQVYFQDRSIILTDSHEP